MATLQDHIRFLGEVREEAGRLADETGLPRGKLMRLYLGTYFDAHTTPLEFRLFRLYEYPESVRRDFLSLHRCTQISNRLIADAGPADLALIANKELFNAYFKDFVRRDWLYLPDAPPEEVRAFFARHAQFLVKGNLTTQGAGIRKLDSAGLDPDAFLREHEGEALLLEEVIRQHPELDALNPSSVNTVRIVTALYKGHTLLVGGALRCGGAGSVVDNFSSGGVAYPLDMETGTVTGPGMDHDGNRYDCHPATGARVTGFQVPFWEETVRAVRAAAGMVPKVGYIGWDVAITAEGPEFVEGNVDVPGPTLIQLGTPDAYGRLTRFLRECDNNTV